MRVIEPRKGRKEIAQVWTAIVLIVSGIVLSFLSFFLSTKHSIDDSILWYFAQCLLYAGGIFGIRNYTITKIGQIENADNKRKTTLE
jgi:hypothetical protein